MDSFHDLGGRQGFGPVTKEDHTVSFHDEWEVRINAITGRLVGQKFFNMDEYRHAIERMYPLHYVSASYFERVYTSVVTLLLEKGVITASDLNAAAGEVVAVSQVSKPGRIQSLPLPDLRIGDTVRVKEDFIGGHVRMPGYVRGKTGTIVGVSPEYHFPDAAAHGLKSPKQRTFDVCFSSQNLWPECADEAEVHVGLFHGYLTKVERA